MNSNSHIVIRSVDKDGRAVVGVRLSKSHQCAWLYEEDYERIVEEYGAPSWRLTPNGNGQAYVRFKQYGLNARNVTVARLVAGDFDRTGVKYKDGNPLNLRSENLYHGDGRGGCPQKSRRKSRAPLVGAVHPTRMA